MQPIRSFVPLFTWAMIPLVLWSAVPRLGCVCADGTVRLVCHRMNAMLAAADRRDSAGCSSCRRCASVAPQASDQSRPHQRCCAARHADAEQSGSERGSHVSTGSCCRGVTMVSPAPQVQIDPVVDLLPGDAAVPNVKAPWPQALPVLSERADDWSPHPPVDRVIAFRALLI